jgi:hypothetical protein
MNEKSTMVELVTELEKLPPCPERQLLLSEAKAGEFHDFKNKKYACGKNALVDYCLVFGKARPEISEALDEISKDVQAGVYDESADAEDEKYLRESVLTDRTMNQAQKNKLMSVLGMKKTKKKDSYGKRYF